MFLIKKIVEAERVELDIFFTDLKLKRTKILLGEIMKEVLSFNSVVKSLSEGSAIYYWMRTGKFKYVRMMVISSMYMRTVNCITPGHRRLGCFPVTLPGTSDTREGMGGGQNN